MSNQLHLENLEEQVYFYCCRYWQLQEEYAVHECLVYNRDILDQEKKQVEQENLSLFRQLCSQQKALETQLEQFQDSTMDQQKRELTFKINNQFAKNDEMAEDIEELREQLEAEIKVKNEAKR